MEAIDSRRRSGPAVASAVCRGRPASLVRAQFIFVALALVADIAVLLHGRFALAALHVGILWPGGIVRRGIALLGRQKIPARRDHEWRPLLIINGRLAIALETESVHDAAREFLVPRSF